MNNYQPGILEEVPLQARYLLYSLAVSADAGAALKALKPVIDGDRTIIGIGLSTLRVINKSVPGMRHFPSMGDVSIDIPSTPHALMLWLRGEDRGELLHRTRQFSDILTPAFELADVIEAFKYQDGSDLTGYEDGTENPTGTDAVNAAIAQHLGDEFNGSSFVAIQQWIHNLDAFQAQSVNKQNHIIGRRISDNEEIEDAPESAHVKRTAQEDFDPDAFIIRRSMPWSASGGEGLMFVAFGKSFDAFEALLSRMVGKDDGVVDALFSFTRPITGGYYWCPPIQDGQIKL